MQRQLYHLQQRFPFKQNSNIMQGVTVSASKYWVCYNIVE